MKKLFCLFLAFLMITLAACDSADQEGNVSKKPAESKGESDSIQTETPWSQLKMLASGMGEGIEYLSLPEDMTMYPADFEGTGEIYSRMSMSGEEMSEAAQNSMAGTITFGGEDGKIEYIMTENGVEIPMILWKHGEHTYWEFPTLFPEIVYREEQVPSMGMDLFSSMELPAMDVSVLKELVTVFEEITVPDENMVCSATDGVQTYRLELDGQKAEKLFDKLEAILSESGYSDMMHGETDILEQLSTTSVGADGYQCDAGIFEIVTDGETYLHAKASAMFSNKIVDEMEFKLDVSDDTLTFTATMTPDKDSEINVTYTMSADKLLLKAEFGAEGQTTKIDLTILAQDDHSFTIDGTISATVDMGGVSISIPLNLEGSFSETEERRVFAFSMDMSLMGQNVEIETGYDLQYTDVTIEYPYKSSNIRIFDETKFYDRLMTVYPEYFGDYVESMYYFNADDTVSLSVYEDGSFDFYCEGTYERNGSSIDITLIDGIDFGGRLTVAGSKYYLNGIELVQEEEDGALSLYYEDEEGWCPWGITLYSDGTCYYFSEIYPSEDGKLYVFMDGTTIGTDSFETIDDYCVRFCGVFLSCFGGELFKEVILYGSAETDIRLELDRYYYIYRITMTNSYQIDGEKLTLKSFGEHTLTYEDGVYYLNGAPCETVSETDDCTTIVYRKGISAVTLSLYSDGICKVVLEGEPVYGYGYNRLTVSFDGGKKFSVQIQHMDSTKMIVFGHILELISDNGSSEL